MRVLLYLLSDKAMITYKNILLLIACPISSADPSPELYKWLFVNINIPPRILFYNFVEGTSIVFYHNIKNQPANKRPSQSSLVSYFLHLTQIIHAFSVAIYVYNTKYVFLFLYVNHVNGF